MSDPSEKEVEHGIASACYSGGPGEPYYQPMLSCPCGFTTGRCESWQEAGELLDEHLASVA